MQISSGIRQNWPPACRAISRTVPGVIGEVWFGVLAPAGTPVTVTDKLRDGLAKSIAQIPTAQLQDAGLSPVASDGKTLGTLIAN